jgi:hypothetical protein
MPTQSFYQRFLRMQGGYPIAAPEATDDLVTTPGTNGFRMAAGTATLVSGTVAVATGLNSVVAFTANVIKATGAATGAAEVTSIWVGAITTGSVTVTGSFNSFVTGSATPSASGTASFYWVAFGQ